MRERVVVIDFGSQYAHLIARRVRELGVYSEIVPYDISAADLTKPGTKAIILSGGPSSVYEPGAPRLKPDVGELIRSGSIPTLGICYGQHVLAEVFGGSVKRGGSGEYGLSLLEVVADDALFAGTPKRQRVWMSHIDRVDRLPPSAVVLARTEYSPIAAFRIQGTRVYGVQFHPEVRHTEHGMQILRNFLYKIAGCSGNWNPEALVEEKIRYIRGKYRGGNILMAASGGVDSTTTAVLIKRAVGSKHLHLVFVNTGLMREGEPQWVVNTLRALGFENVHFVDAEDEFLSALRGVTDPEEKRRIIATKFIEVFTRVAEQLEAKYGKFRYLAQGTIYPDRIETGSASKAAAKIKSHHNVALPPWLKYELIEPLADLYKDEVRRLALKLGIPEEIVWRHPFPGPGLAIRIIGEVTREKLRILRKVDVIVEEEMRKSGFYRKVWQAFPVLLPVRTVGVRGDSRSYDYAVALRIVCSEDAMTADPAELPWDFLKRLAGRIVNEVLEVNRVLYDLTSKPPATIEFE